MKLLHRAQERCGLVRELLVPCRKTGPVLINAQTPHDPRIQRRKRAGARGTLHGFTKYVYRPAETMPASSRIIIACPARRRRLSAAYMAKCSSASALAPVPLASRIELCGLKTALLHRQREDSAAAPHLAVVVAMLHTFLRCCCCCSPSLFKLIVLSAPAPLASGASQAIAQ